MYFCTVNRKGDISAFKRIFSVTSLLLYISFLSFSTIHTISHEFTEHHQESEVCDGDHESACHNYEVHFIQEEKCEHVGHVMTDSEHCELCAIFALSHSDFNSTEFSNSIDYISSNDGFHIKNEYYQSNFFYEKVRGPPVG